MQEPTQQYIEIRRKCRSRYQFPGYEILNSGNALVFAVLTKERGSASLCNEI